MVRQLLADGLIAGAQLFIFDGQPRPSMPGPCILVLDPGRSARSRCASKLLDLALAARPGRPVLYGGTGNRADPDGRHQHLARVPGGAREPPPGPAGRRHPQGAGGPGAGVSAWSRRPPNCAPTPHSLEAGADRTARVAGAHPPRRTPGHPGPHHQEPDPGDRRPPGRPAGLQRPGGRRVRRAGTPVWRNCWATPSPASARCTRCWTRSAATPRAGPRCTSCNRSRPTRWCGWRWPSAATIPLASQRKLVAELRARARIQADTFRLHQTIVNLVRNAFQATARGRRGGGAHPRRRRSTCSSTSRTPASPSPPRSRPACSSRSSPPRARTAWAWACRCAGPRSRATAAPSPAASRPGEPTRFRIKLPRDRRATPIPSGPERTRGPA